MFLPEYLQWEIEDMDRCDCFRLQYSCFETQAINFIIDLNYFSQTKDIQATFVYNSSTDVHFKKPKLYFQDEILKQDFCDWLTSAVT